MIYVLLHKLFKTSQVTSDVIYAAISVYLLIGVFWGIVHTLLEFVWPGSFTLESGLKEKGFYAEFGQDMIYYSFVSLTTVGYGDIVSISQPAKFLSVLEAATGQIYLTVLVARLVGMHISQSRS